MERTLVDIINSFLRKFGHDNGGSIRSDQGGELAKSPALADMVLREHNYVFEPTGANSPSQNGGVETSINAIQMEDQMDMDILSPPWRMISVQERGNQQ
jgi:hypothetical protein